MTFGYARVQVLNEGTGRLRSYVRSGSTGKWYLTDLTTYAPPELWPELDRLAAEAEHNER